MALCRKAATVSSSLAISLRRLHFHHRLATFSPSAAHWFSTGHPFNDEHTEDPVAMEEIYPKLVKDSLYCFKVELQGLTSEDLKIWVDENRDIIFEGKCKTQPKFGYEGRIYKGIIEAKSKMDCDVDQLKAKLKHGVLWVTVPLNQEAKEKTMSSPRQFLSASAGKVFYTW
ncbi:heat shock 22 kDa protein, mitochondrial-like [Cornus florida]|uniref:heat shock 22 kDa protein, mitochondrial-like n=1 Tax=Cornus florida TaxID=4283 RepID=UPI00289722EC|nr:heat shock 22 kDa protein, mitochondrial-like [Cornus florida]